MFGINRNKREELVDRLASHGYIKSQEVMEAMKKVRRELFLPREQEKYAYVDQPLSIGEGQTISAPHMVGIMCEALKLERGQKILEIGTGSGYNAAVMAEIIKEGHIYSVEVIEKLAVFAEKNIKNGGYSHLITVISGDGTRGYEPEKPYDRIVVTAAAPQVPQQLVDQLKEGGLLLIPTGDRFIQDLLEIRKEGDQIKKRNLGGCSFVPLVGEFGWK